MIKTLRDYAIKFDREINEGKPCYKATAKRLAAMLRIMNFISEYTYMELVQIINKEYEKAEMSMIEIENMMVDKILHKLMLDEVLIYYYAFENHTSRLERVRRFMKFLDCIQMQECVEKLVELKADSILTCAVRDDYIYLLDEANTFLRIKCGEDLESHIEEIYKFEDDVVSMDFYDSAILVKTKNAAPMEYIWIEITYEPVVKKVYRDYEKFIKNNKQYNVNLYITNGTVFIEEDGAARFAGRYNKKTSFKEYLDNVYLDDKSLYEPLLGCFSISDGKLTDYYRMRICNSTVYDEKRIIYSDIIIGTKNVGKVLYDYANDEFIIYNLEPITEKNVVKIKELFGLNEVSIRISDDIV